MNCGNDCGCAGLSGLGQSQPFKLTSGEISLFMARHGLNPKVANYMVTHDPPWGITLDADGRTYLIWYDDSDYGISTLHVVDITGDPIAAAIDQAPHEPPGFADVLMQRIRELSGSAMKFMTLAAWILTVYALYGVYRDVRR